MSLPELMRGAVSLWPVWAGTPASLVRIRIPQFYPEDKPLTGKLFSYNNQQMTPTPEKRCFGPNICAGSDKIPRRNRMSEQENNLRIAESIYSQFAWNGKTFQEGDFLALLDGKIVAVADNPDDAIAALRALDPDPNRGMVIEVAPPVDDVIR